MRRFELHRKVDVTGVSGVGIIAEGVEFSRGKVVLTWLTGTPGTTFFDSIDNMIAVHGHDGKTVVEWLDPDPDRVVTIPVKLGWSNEDTGPEDMRLYALDAGDQPRWVQPHARTAETALRETRAWIEGARGVVVVNTHRGTFS